MNIWQSLGGMVVMEAVSADPAGLLRSLNGAGIPLYGVWAGDEMTLRFQISRRDRSRVAALCEKRGDSLRMAGRLGIYWTLRGLLRRPVLLLGFGALLGLMLFLPTRILFLQVEGNRTLPAQQILAAAEDCGIRFGASRRAVRSEKMKNALLAAVPELQWAGINTRGCIGVISVREREKTLPPEGESGFYSIVAARDGIITDCTVTGGNGLCAVGQAVKKGQVLISPYTDCGICIRVDRPEGEIYARTRREIRVVTPSESTFRLRQRATGRKISLLLGKKRINLWKDSGIWDGTCGRMYKEYHVTLPGGFRLPIALAVETLTRWETGVVSFEPENREAALIGFARQLTERDMIAGKIHSQGLTVTRQEGFYLLEGSFVCTEMIGREHTEKNGDTNEQNNGTDR